MPRGSTPYERKTPGAVTKAVSVTCAAEVLEQVRVLLQDQFTGKTAYAGLSTLVESLLRTWLRHRREHDAVAAAKLDEWDRRRAVADSVTLSDAMMKELDKEMPKMPMEKKESQNA